MILMVINNILINTNETLKTPKNRPKLTYTVILTYFSSKVSLQFFMNPNRKKIPKYLLNDGFK